MALTYDGTNGLFTRLGKIFGMMDAVKTHQSDLKTRLLALQAEYTDADFYMIASLVASIESRLVQTGQILNDLNSAAQATLVETCYADSLVSTRGVLPEKTVPQALLYLNREMVADAKTVNRTTISKSAVTTGTNTGNGTLVFSELPPNSMSAGGTQYPCARSERLEARCIQDAQDGMMRAGEERFEIRGWASYPNLDYRWPAGSGTRMTMAAVHAGVDNGARYENMMRNSNFANFTSNLPDGWESVVGTAGTHYLQETSVTYRGSSALKFVGDAANLTQIRQQMGSVDGTPATLVADRLYLLSVYCRTSAGITAGNLRICLCDSAGTLLSATSYVDVPYTTGTTYGLKTIPFRAPLALPSSVYVGIKLTTAASAGGIFYIDELVVNEMRQIAEGGVGLTIVAGSTNFVVNDSLRLLVTNNFEGKFNKSFDRSYDLYGNGVVLPNSAAPNISDALIV